MIKEFQKLYTSDIQRYSDLRGGCNDGNYTLQPLGSDTRIGCEWRIQPEKVNY